MVVFVVVDYEVVLVVVVDVFCGDVVIGEGWCDWFVVVEVVELFVGDVLIVEFDSVGYIGEERVVFLRCYWCVDGVCFVFGLFVDCFVGVF